MLLKYWDVVSDLCAFGVNVLGQVTKHDKPPQDKRDSVACSEPVWEGECTAQAHQIYNALKPANQNPFRYIFKDLSF